MTAVKQAQHVAQLIPTKVRATMYLVIGAAVALEAIWDLVPEVLEGKVLKTVTALGFGVALGNTSD